MKSGKAFCLALGFFLGTSTIPAAYAQKQQDQPNYVQENLFQDLSDHRGKLSFQNQPWPNWSGVISGDHLGWFQGAGAHTELNLAAADDSVREHLNLPPGQGVVVLWVAPNSSAAQAGVQQNDVLLMLGDNPLSKPDDLYDRLKQAGEKATPLTLLRSGSRVTLQVQPLIRVTLRPVVSAAPPREYWIGLTVTAIEPVLRAQLRLMPDHGVIVNEVYQGSPAAKAGIAHHDIILAIGGVQIADPNDLARSVQANGEKPLGLAIIGKGGKPRTVAVTPERRKATETSQVARIPTNSLVYDFVRPGVVLDYGNALNRSSIQPGVLRGDLLINSNLSPKTQDAGSALDRRLDTLDSDLKELRKLVEELKKTATKIIERQKSTSESTTKD